MRNLVLLAERHHSISLSLEGGDDATEESSSDFCRHHRDCYVCSLTRDPSAVSHDDDDDDYHVDGNHSESASDVCSTLLAAAAAVDATVGARNGVNIPTTIDSIHSLHEEHLRQRESQRSVGISSLLMAAEAMQRSDTPDIPMPSHDGEIVDRIYISYEFFSSLGGINFVMH